MSRRGERTGRGRWEDVLLQRLVATLLEEIVGLPRDTFDPSSPSLPEEPIRCELLESDVGDRPRPSAWA